MLVWNIRKEKKNVVGIYTNMDCTKNVAFVFLITFVS